jgi:hypothetical protein
MAAERTCDAKTIIIFTDAVAVVNVVVAVVVAVAAIHPRTVYEGTKGEKTCSSTIYLNLALVGGWVVHATPRNGHFTFGEDVVVLCRRLCGPQDGLDG